MIDEKIIKYASPTLAGIKTGSLFKIYLNEVNNLDDTLLFYNSIFSKFNINMFVLYKTNSYILIYLYRINSLKKDLNNNKSLKLLIDLGYPVNNLDSILSYLKLRFETLKRTPHELGLFLGYPLEDVLGFIHNKGMNFKLSGCWKVYDNEEKCKIIFDSYKKCKYNNMKLFYMGFSLESLIYKPD